MSTALTPKYSETILRVIESFDGNDASPIAVVRAAASQNSGMDIREAEDALCILFETGQVYANDDMNLEVRKG